MAIVVEEEKSRVNIVSLLGWLSVIAVIGVAIYYIFFVTPESVIIPPPAGFQNITPIAQVTLHPEDVLNSPSFVSLQSPSFPLPTPQGPAGVGRSDPFLAP